MTTTNQINFLLLFTLLISSLRISGIFEQISKLRKRMLMIEGALIKDRTSLVVKIKIQSRIYSMKSVIKVNHRWYLTKDSAIKSTKKTKTNQYTTLEALAG